MTFHDVFDDVTARCAYFAVNLAGHDSEMMAVVRFSATVKGVRLYDLAVHERLKEKRSLCSVIPRMRMTSF